MIHLYIKSSGAKELVWQDMLKEWCVAHRVTEDHNLKESEIHEGKKKVVGPEAIDRFLSEYKKFMDDWYDCRCDKWTT